MENDNQPVEQPMSTNPTPSSKKQTGVIIVVLILVIITAAGYFVLNRGPKVEPVITNNEVKNDWKILSGGEHGYEIKYPPTWKVDVNRSTNQTIVFDTGVAESRESISIQAANVTLEEWKKGLDQSVIVGSQWLNIGGEQALQINTNEFGQKLLGVIHGDKLYIFSTVGLMLENKMLETFKFTDSSSVVSDWKTYTNTKYGISIKYPPYNNELKALNGNINVGVLDDTKPENGPSAFWVGVAQKIWHERYEKRGIFKIGDECVNDEQETCRVYSLNPFVLKISENYADPYPDPYKLVFPTEKFQLTVGPLPQNITDKELNQIISTFKFTK